MDRIMLSKYGIYRLNCPCGQFTLKKKPDVESCCEACGQKAYGELIKWEFHEDVACQIATYSEQMSDAVRKHADQHGLLVWKKSKRTYYVMEKSHPIQISYKDGEGRSATELRMVFQGNWQAAYGYIRKHTPALPKHLVPKEK